MLMKKLTQPPTKHHQFIGNRILFNKHRQFINYRNYQASPTKFQTRLLFGYGPQNLEAPVEFRY